MFLLIFLFRIRTSVLFFFPTFGDRFFVEIFDRDGSFRRMLNTYVSNTFFEIDVASVWNNIPFGSFLYNHSYQGCIQFILYSLIQCEGGCFACCYRQPPVGVSEAIPTLHLHSVIEEPRIESKQVKTWWAGVSRDKERKKTNNYEARIEKESK